MCEYCGCQGLSSIKLLTSEHDRLDHVGPPKALQPVQTSERRELPATSCVG